MHCIHLQPIKTKCSTLTSILTSLSSLYTKWLLNNFFPGNLKWKPLQMMLCGPLCYADDGYLQNILKHFLHKSPIFITVQKIINSISNGEGAQFKSFQKRYWTTTFAYIEVKSV